MRPPRAALGVVLLVLASGCLGGGGPPPSDPGAEAVVDDARAAGTDVETYTFENTITVTARSDERSQQFTISMTGAVDRPNRLMRATSRYQDVAIDTYVDGGTSFTECREPWGGWGVENVTTDEWRLGDPLGRQIQLLNASPVYWAGNETVEGQRVHVVEARPSTETLNQYSERRSSGDVLDANLENATLTAWIVADTGRVLETSFEFRVSEGQGSADARMSTTFGDYGDAVNVTVPTAARTDQRELGCPGA